MAQENPLSSSSPEKQASEKQQIQKTLKQLDQHASKKEAQKTRLNESFMTRLSVSQGQNAPEKEKSMLLLSNDYIQQLEAFKAAQTPSEARDYLKESEALWQEHTKVVLQEAPEEASFFKDLRVHLFSTLNHKLEHISQKNFQQVGREQLCRDILVLQDKILEELGHGPQSEERKRLQEIAKGFVS